MKGLPYPSLDYDLVLKPVEQGDRGPIVIAWIARSAGTISKLNRQLGMHSKSEFSRQPPERNHAYCIL
jgi:hypothetical protein